MTGHLITPEEFATRWGGNVTPRWVLEARIAHKWPCVKVGRKVRFTEQQFADIQARHTITPTTHSSALEGQTSRSRNA